MTDDVETEAHRDPSADKLAKIAAHPSYEAVKAANPHREPSFAELEEHAAAQAHEGLSKREKLAVMLDKLLTDAGNQVKHNAPLSPDIIRQIEAIRALVG
jgi:hypothetical protein